MTMISFSDDSVEHESDLGENSDNSCGMSLKTQDMMANPATSSHGFSELSCDTMIGECFRVGSLDHLLNLGKWTHETLKCWTPFSRPWTHSHLWNLWKKSPESGRVVPVYTSDRVFKGQVTSDFVALMYQLASDIQVASNEKRILCPSLPIFLTHQENPSGSLDRTARNAHSPQIESEYGCIDWLTLKNRWNSWLSSPTSVSSPREITVSDQSSQSAGHTSGLPKLHEMPNDGPNACVPYQP